MSIKVPDEKTKAVIDAMEREMMDKLATKADLAHLREILTRDIARVEERMTSQITAQFATFETRLTIRMGVMMVSMITAATALIGGAVYFR